MAAQTAPTAAHENRNNSYIMECALQDCNKCLKSFVANDKGLRYVGGDQIQDCGKVEVV